MTFCQYALIKAQYEMVEQHDNLQLCFCADRDCTDHVWQAPLSIKEEPKASNSFYVLMLPKGLDFTEKTYETYKGFFERYIKREKEKEKLENINKDFV